MKKPATVRNSIFQSNARMLGVSLLLIVLINLGMIKIYWESIEQGWMTAIEQTAEADAMTVEALVKEWTVHQRSFYGMLAVDALLCVVAVVIVSLFFTGRLATQISHPLEILKAGTRRIRRNDFGEQLQYEGEEEFEELCIAFNEMQDHLDAEQKKNRAYETARTEMISGISHDLRTPLTAVQGAVKSVLDGVVTDPGQQKVFLSMAYRRTGEMEQLLRQLLELSRLETGKIPIQLQEVLIGDFLADYVQEKQELFSGEQIELLLKLDSDGGKLRLDPEQMRRILDNLVENSRKYVKKRPLVINIELVETGNRISIRIQDNGDGVPEEALGHLFEQFYRVDESRNQEKGNGLGLYIVKRLAEAMQGRVWAENRSGLTVYLEFPKWEDTQGQ